MARRLIIIFSLLLVGIGGLRAQLTPTSFEVSTTRDSLLIGDTLTLRVDIQKDMARDLSLPSFEKGMLTPQIEILEGPKVDTIGVHNRTIDLRISYRITSFEEGSYVLDSFPLLEGLQAPFDTLFSEGEVRIAFGTYEIDTTQDVAIDIKPLIGAPYSWAEFQEDVKRYWWVLLCAIVVAGAVVAGLWWWRKRRIAKKEAERELPSHLRAINALEKVRNKKLWQGGLFKEYFSEITDILRVYMEERYGFGAMEMTSAQIMRELEKFDLLPKLHNSIKELFTISDLAKFAKGVPTTEECETGYFDAYYFVEQTKQVEQTEEGKSDEKQ